MIENLLEVGRHFQKTSYEKEVEGEKQASIKLLKALKSDFLVLRIHSVVN